MATNKKKTIVRKKTTKASAVQRSKKSQAKVVPKKKSPSKKTTKKSVIKKSVVKKKPARNISGKASSKAGPARKKATTKKPLQISSQTLKQIESEQEKMKEVLQEIRSLELDNKRLENQIAKAQTKQEILAELKTYLSLLKQSPRPTPTTQETFNTPNPQTKEMADSLERNKEELTKEIEKVQTKDKLISRLKNLLAVKMKENDSTDNESPLKELEFHPTYQNQEKNNDFYAAKEKPNSSIPPPPRQEENTTRKPVTVQVENATIKQIQNIIDEHDEEEITTHEKIKVRKSDFQTQKTRGVLTPEEAEEYSALLKEATKEVNKVFLGQEQVVERVLISVICDAHTLLEGVPGLAKTLLVETLAKIIDGTTFKRIQFLPDLLPSDIIGGQVFNPKTAEYKIYKGPIFANFVLCDEINRAPPKTHAAVMEAMQEKKINIENEEFILDRPFFVLATQNPLENKGTYDLPEAVLDRFMFKVLLDYPRREIEYNIITENSTTKNLKKGLKKIISKEVLLDMQAKVKTVYLADKIRDYILDLVEATRGLNKDIEGFKYVKYGAGVRASIYLSLAAKAKAVIEGRNYVLPDDVDFIAPDVLRHRVALNYRGKAHNITPDKIVEEILLKVKAV